MTKSEGAKIYARRRAASQSKLNNQSKSHSKTLSEIDPPPSQLNATLPLFPLDQIQAKVADIGAVPAGAGSEDGDVDGENASLASTPSTEITESGSMGGKSVETEVDSGVEVSDGAGSGSEDGKRGKTTAVEGPQTRARVRKSARI